MDVNSILCVGREEMSVAKPSVKIQKQGYSRLACEDDLRLHLNEPRILPIPPSACRDFSPPTKSILRSKSPSPKQGSPASLRNVRFSDKDADNDIAPMFTKLHVNDACQTDDPSSGVGTQTSCATPYKPVFERTKPLPYQSKTSTPRNGSVNGAPNLEFNTPRDDVIAYRAPSPVRIKIHSEGQKDASVTRQSRKDTFLSKKVNTSTQFPLAEDISLKTACTQTGMMPENVPNGSRIIRNLDLSASPRSQSPMTRSVAEYDSTTESSTQTGEQTKKANSKGTMTSFTSLIPNGEKILQNWERAPVEKFRHETTQTDDSDNESIRSQSPDFPARDMSAMDENHSHFKHNASQTGDDEVENYSQLKHNSSQTGQEDVEMFTSASTQTAAEDGEEEENGEYPRSVCVQTDDPDTYKDSDTKQSSRSIGIQAPAKPETFPDGSRIIQNMIITPPTNNDNNHQAHDENGGNKVNDPKWTEFVQSFDLSDMSSQTESDVHEKLDTVLVYNAEEATPSHMSTKDDATLPNYELKPCQKLSDHSARSQLQGQSYMKREVDKIKTEVGLKAKSTPFQPAVANPSPCAFSDTSLPKPFKAWQESEQNNLPRYADSGLWPNSAHKTSPYSFLRRSTSPRQAIRHLSEPTESEITTRRHNGRSNSLTFTPIETYSFKPETVSALRSSMAQPIKKPEHILADKMSKNTFIQGLDLGPIPHVPKTVPNRLQISPYYTNKSSGYKAPIDKMTTGCQRYGNTGREFGRESSMRYRSSSAPKSTSPSSVLTPNLSKLRSSVVRKYGKSHDHQSSLPNRNYLSANTKSHSTGDSSVLRQSRYDSYKQSKLSNEDKLLRKWAASPPSSIGSQSDFNHHKHSTRSTAPVHSPRRISPQRPVSSVPVHSPKRTSPQRQVSSERTADLQYLYLDALENTANQRLSSRERSPIRVTLNGTQQARSRSHSPVIKRKTVPTENGVKYDTPYCEDNYVTMETTRSIRMPVPSASPKQLSSKPPIPKVIKRSRSSSADRSPSGSFRVIGGREPRSGMREIVGTPHRNVEKGAPRVPQPVGNFTTNANDVKPQSGTLTIGRAPEGLQNNECVFLGHDTIQKIIEKAHL